MGQEDNETDGNQDTDFTGDYGFSVDTSLEEEERSSTCPPNQEKELVTFVKEKPVIPQSMMDWYSRNPKIKMFCASGYKNKTNYHDYVLATKNIFHLINNKSTSSSTEQPNNLSSESVYLNSCIAKLTNELGNNGKSTLCDALGILQKYVQKGIDITAKEKQMKKETWIELPTNLKDLKSIFNSYNRKNSLRNILPIPYIEKLADGLHGFCSQLDILAYVSFTSPMQPTHEIKPRHRLLFEKKTVKTTLSQMNEYIINDNTPNVLCLWMYWSDGFEPNRTKVNRKGVWTMTLTLFMMDMKEKHVFLVKTMPLSSGPGKGSSDKENHEDVFQRLLVDEKKIKNEKLQLVPHMFPSRYHDGGVARFYCMNVGVLMDNIERRASFGLLQGNANNHKVFGLNCNFGELKVPFPACGICSKKYLNTPKKRITIMC